MPLNIVILAAGKGTRMRSSLPKVLHPVGGKPLLQHVVDTAKSLNPGKIYVVIGSGAEQVRQQLQDESVIWVEQLEQKGTGHAVQQVMPHIPAEEGVLILNGDVPLVRLQTLRPLVDTLKTVPLCLLTAMLDDPTGYGRIVRNKQGGMTAIVEQKDATAQQQTIAEINTGIIAARAGELSALLNRLDCDNAQGEYYLTSVIALGYRAGLRMASIAMDDFNEVSGINDRRQLAAMERFYQCARANALMAQGVTLADPSRIDIRGEISIGLDSVIDVNCVFNGQNTLGKNVRIGPNCVISNAQIDDNVVIEAHCVIDDAVIGACCVVGPFARVRPGTVLAEQAKIGNFVETKNSQIGRGSKVNHLSYVGDSDVGDHVNIGAGTITANYDGANKHRTQVGDNVSIGSNSVLVAPLVLGDGSTVGAGATITRDVADNQLVLTRAPLKKINGWQRPKKTK